MYVGGSGSGYKFVTMSWDDSITGSWWSEVSSHFELTRGSKVSYSLPLLFRCHKVTSMWLLAQWRSSCFWKVVLSLQSFRGVDKKRGRWNLLWDPLGVAKSLFFVTKALGVRLWFNSHCLKHKLTSLSADLSLIGIRKLAPQYCRAWCRTSVKYASLITFTHMYSVWSCVWEIYLEYYIHRKISGINVTGSWISF